MSVLLLLLVGCGTVQTRHATEQLLISDAVDQSISQLEFSALASEKVFLDTQYLRRVNGVGFVNADYITSALRERMVADQCRLQDNRNDADFVVEVRVGALGTDGHDVNYGIPGSGALSATGALLGTSGIPSLPEISLARKDERRAAAKIGVFAYHRESKEPIWQPGAVQGSSVAKATWVLGAGPFHDGRIYQESTVGQDVLEVPSVDEGRDLISNVVSRVTNIKQAKDAAGETESNVANEQTYERLPRPETPAAKVLGSKLAAR